LGGAFGGPAAVGILNAARLLVSPLHFLTPALHQILLPRLVKHYSRNIPTNSLIGTASLIVAALASAYLLALAIAFKPVVTTLLPSDYLRTHNLVIIAIFWSLIAFAQLLLIAPNALAQAMKFFRNLAVIELLAAIAAILGSAIFCWTWGYVGVLPGTLLGELTLVVLIVRLSRN